ncbi:MAG TPA: alternative ribosome rescue aminoacyl-tRNA hydrolase ArfB [Chthoniobacterales bacterium]
MRKEFLKPGASSNIEQRMRKLGISEGDLVESFSRSSGPGGQNVNKVNSKVMLRWPLLTSAGLPSDVRDRFVAAYRRRMTTEGELVLSSERFRDQPKNVADCLEKLRDLLLTVAVAPKPRRVSKPTKASKRRRVEAKKQRTEVKQRRQPPSFDDR